MTEPAPGAGSDPRAMQTTVARDGDEFVVNGTKWLITGADGAEFVIIMGREADDETRPTGDDAAGRHGHTWHLDRA